MTLGGSDGSFPSWPNFGPFKVEDLRVGDLVTVLPGWSIYTADGTTVTGPRLAVVAGGAKVARAGRDRIHLYLLDDGSLVEVTFTVASCGGVIVVSSAADSQSTGRHLP